MSNLTSRDIKQKIHSYLESTFQKREGHEGHGGWGKNKDNPISIVNTVEALLTLREIEELEDYLRNAHSVKKYLCDELSEITSKGFSTIRYLSYGAIGLDIIGECKLRDMVVDRLLGLALKGGWPNTANRTNAGLVSTFQAVFALQQIGKPVDQFHYDWLRSHQKPNNLCSFAHSDPVTSIGASCMVLYLLSKGRQDYKSYPRDLANALQTQLNDTFTQMLDVSHGWVSTDPQTNFRVYGYGFGLRGLHELGILNLQEVGAGKFIEALSRAMLPAPEGQLNSTHLSCDPTQSWIPAVLEISIALRTILNAFDLVTFYSEIEKSSAPDTDERQVTFERESRLIELRTAVLVAQEKEVLKRDGLWEQIIANQEMLTEQIDEKLRVTINKFASDQRNLISKFLRKLALRVLFITMGGTILLICGISIFIRLYYPNLGSTITDVITILCFILGIASLLLPFFKGRTKNLEQPIKTSQPD